MGAQMVRAVGSKTSDQAGDGTANNDSEIGEMIAEAMQKLGNGSVIAVEEAKSLDHHRDPRRHINSAIANSTSMSSRDRNSTAVAITLGFFMDCPFRSAEIPAEAHRGRDRIHLPCVAYEPG
jgi:chaperonin GroEL (HSP60 family)